MANMKDSEDLTRVGPGTVMGEFIREYWLPAAKSGELVADGDPMRLMLMGEQLVAFRETGGKVGVMHHRCPHRGVSLFLGRNEQGGIRCIYHGWKFDATGKCIEMPSVPAHLDCKHKVRSRAYRTEERNGVIWVYMGKRQDDPPPLPLLEAGLLPETEIDIMFLQRRSNWFQNLEGDIDTSHFNFLHVGSLDAGNVPEGHALEHTAGHAPGYYVRDSANGVSYVAHTKIPEDRTYWRFAHYLFPFWALIPQGDIRYNVVARAWVPMDDEHTMLVFLRWRTKTPGLGAPLKDGKPLPGATLVQKDFTPNDTSWFGRWRLDGCEANDWLLDRDAQRRNIVYSGMEGVHLQDAAMTESMGAITDHAAEQLGPSDVMVARSRRRVLQEARKFREEGSPPPGVEQPESYFEPRGGYYITPSSVDWEQAYAQQIQHFVHPGRQKADAES